MKVDRTIEIEATEFTYEPDSITVKQGKIIRFKVTNTGKLMHEFVIGDEEAQQAHGIEMQGLSPEEMIEHMRHHPNGISVQRGETKELIGTFGPQQQVQYTCHVYAALAVAVLTAIAWTLAIGGRGTGYRPLLCRGIAGKQGR